MTDTFQVLKEEQQQTNINDQYPSTQPLNPPPNFNQSQEVSSDKPSTQQSSMQQQQHNPKSQQSNHKQHEEMIATATTMKEKGNKLFKQKDLSEAIARYSDGLKVLDPKKFKGATPDQLQKMAELSSIMLNNIGTCYYHGYDWMKAEIFLNEALIINPRYVKALHKRALARYEMKRYEEAFEDIKLAFSLDRANGQIHASYEKILLEYNKAKQEEKQNMKKMSQKIFRPESPKNSQKEQEEKEEKEEGGNSGLSLTTVAIAVGIIGFAAYKYLVR